jgi:ribosome-associated toxin RatA of RatAB toxin-antitoxin module
MRTIDEIDAAAPPNLVFRFAADVEGWPRILPHYRYVRFVERSDPRVPHSRLTTRDSRLVEMSANRPFGAINWPTWWMSEMWVDQERREVRYKHIMGITRGMDVLWRVEPRGAGSHIHLLHEWGGPAWPLIRYPAAEWVIGPVFVHGIASRTIAGVARAAEAARV